MSVSNTPHRIVNKRAISHKYWTKGLLFIRLNVRVKQLYQAQRLVITVAEGNVYLIPTAQTYIKV